MPRVPVYQGQSVGPAPAERLQALPPAYQDIRTSAEMFGAAQGRALQSLGQGIGSLGDAVAGFIEEEEARANDTAAAKARAQMNQFFTDDIYGAEGFMSQRGEGAVNAFPAVRQSMADRRQELMQGLPTQEARQIFDQSTQNRFFEIERALASHVRRERLTMEQDIAGAEVSTAARLALSAYNNPEMLNDAITSAEAAIIRQAQRIGQADIVTQDQLEGFREGLYDQISGLAAQQNPAQIVTLAGGPSDTGFSAAPRGIRNNNPLNIEAGDFAARQQSIGSDGRFALFPNAAGGIAAASTLLQSYSAQGYDTIAEIIGRWAPSNENDTQAYITAVSRAVGVDADTEIDVSDPTVLQPLLEAMIQHENGQQPYDDTTMQAGMGLAGIGQIPETYDPTAAAVPVELRDVAEPAPGSPEWWSGASPEGRASALRTAEVYLRQTRTAARTALQPRIEAELTMLREGLTIPAGQSVTYSEVMSAYDTPEEGQRVWESLQGERQYSERIASVAMTHPNGQAALLDQMRPEPGPNFVRDQEQYAEMQQIVAADRELRAQDPARYVINRTPVLMEAWGMKGPDDPPGDLDPNEMRRAIELTMATQTDIGVPLQVQQPMMGGAAAGFVGAWQGEADASTRLDMLWAVTGALNNDDIARRVLGQLTDAGLPADMPYVLDVYRDPGRRQAAIDMMFALTAPEESALTSEARTDLTSELDDYWDASAMTVHLRAAFQMQDADLAYRSQDERNIFERLVTRHMATYGDADAAVQYANDTLFGSISTVSDPDLAYVTLPAGIDTDAFSNGLLELRDELIVQEAIQDGEVEPTSPILGQVRQALQRAGEAQGEETATGAQTVDDALALNYIQDLVADGVWVNDGDDNYVLLDPRTGLAVPGMGATTYSFSTRQVLEASLRRLQRDLAGLAATSDRHLMAQIRQQIVDLNTILSTAINPPGGAEQ